MIWVMPKLMSPWLPIIIQSMLGSVQPTLLTEKVLPYWLTEVLALVLLPTIQLRYFFWKKPQSNHFMNLYFFQVMIHRRLLDDDAFGVDQPLNETEFGGKGLVARGTHYLLFDPSVEDQLVRTRLLAKSIFASPIVTLNRFFQYPVFCYISILK